MTKSLKKKEIARKISLLAICYIVRQHLARVERANRPKVQYILEESEQKRQLLQRIISGSYERKCHDLYRVNSFLFNKICYLIKDKVHTTFKLPIECQVAIFLSYIGHADITKKQGDYFALSFELIMLSRKNVANAIYKYMYSMYVKPVVDIPNLGSNPKFKHFQGASGCVDGSHIAIRCRQNEVSWRNRKGYNSTNSLLVSTIDNKLLFSYCSVGHEGCGSDSTIFKSCVEKFGLKCEGFVLGDLGYCLCDWILVPYKGVRYHLQEWAKLINGRPQNSKELFNLRHAQLRNQIERAFGVLKMRFRVLREPIDRVSKKDMWILIYACITIHNLIRIDNVDIDDKYFVREFVRTVEEEMPPNDIFANVPHQPQPALDPTVDSNRMKIFRETIATEMWNDYVMIRNSRS
jgi:hypothetical protein